MTSHQPLKSKLSEDAHRYAFQYSIPWFVVIELTLQCNLICNHCYNYNRNFPLPPNLKDKLSSQRILSLLSELKDAGSLMISFSGGEALMHPDLFLFIKRARELNLFVTIKSNGTLITPLIAKKLKDYEVGKVEISLYGSNSLEHDWLTQKDDSFLKTIEGIKNLRANDIDVEISLIIHQKNYRSIEKMIQIAEEFNCSYGISTEITKRYDNTFSDQEIRITEAQFEEILKSNIAHHFVVQNKEKNLQCECARTVCGINANGDVYPCIGAPIPSGNITERNFSDIWKNSDELNKIRNLTFDDFKDCKDCSLIENCSRNSGGAYVNTKNYTGKNPQDCTEAKTRKKLSL